MARKKGILTQEQAEAYLENYKDMVKKLSILSRVAIRQFLGSRPDSDPRVDYMMEFETFKNLANAQISALTRVVTEKLKVKRDDFLAINKEELEKQVKAMEKDLCVTGWTTEGQPNFNLQAYRERTAGWPP